MNRVLSLQGLESSALPAMVVAWSTMSDHCNSGASVDNCTNEQNYLS